MKKTVNNSIKINNIPYFLLKNYIMEKAEIDEEKMMLYGENKESYYEKSNPLFILFLKLIPVLIIVPFVNIPENKISLLIFIFTLFFLVSVLALYKYTNNLFVKIFILTTLLATMYISLYFPMFEIEEYFFIFVHYFLVSFVLFVVLRDLIQNNFNNYYSLIDIYTEKEGVVIYRGKRKLGKIPFSKKSLLSFNVKEDKGYRFSFRGHFFIMDQNINKEKEND